MGRRFAGTACGVAWRVSIACLTLSLAPPIVGAGPACVGDCARNGTVTIDDLITGVNIALGTQAVSACTAMDFDGDGTVTVSELLLAVVNALDGCSPTQTPAGTGTVTPPIVATASPTNSPPPPTPTSTPIPSVSMHFCDLPGSVQSTAPGVSVVPGAPAGAPDLTFLHLPVGFCAHFFANVGNARQLRFAPGGELFVASPTQFTTGGNGTAGRAAILVLPDDDHDGVADSKTVFLGAPANPLPSTQGLLFANEHLYYQDGTKIMRLPYAAGDRTPSGPSEQVADITIYVSNTIHWPKTLDIADDGTIYVGNGGDDPEPCDAQVAPAARPFHGGILKLDGSPGGTPVAKGFRNPISVRCAKGHGTCFAIELTKDFSDGMGGREKLLPIRQGDDWGFPCCATKDRPFPASNGVPDCSGVAAEIDSFFVGNTPFDLDFETGKWPEPWKNHVFVPLHGKYDAGEGWQGEGLVAIDFNAMTGQVLPGSDLMGTPQGALSDFATGWDVPIKGHGRPANVAFAPDGRLFLGNDVSGDIIWIAPMGL